MNRALAYTLTVLTLTGCTLGPNYTRPTMELPTDYSAALSEKTVKVDPAADTKTWWKLFKDPILDALIAESLANNRDLAAAAENIVHAQAQLVLTERNQQPQFNITSERSRQHQSVETAFVPPANAVEYNRYSLLFNGSWTLDFWGQYRRATEGAKADLAASEAGRDVIRLSLISQVIQNYTALRAVDINLVVARQIVIGYRAGLDLQNALYGTGSISDFELSQSEALVAEYEALIPGLEQQQTVLEGSLALLAGRTPKALMERNVDRGALTAPEIVEVPAGLSSDLLANRPDLRQAEAQLHSFTAASGVARAYYFPTLTLSGFFGYESATLTHFITHPAQHWQLALDLFEELGTPGQISATIDLADSLTRQAALNYQQAVASAFNDVHNALVLQRRARDNLLSQRKRVAMLDQACHQSIARFNAGTANGFDVLNAQLLLYAAMQDAAYAERDRCNAIVSLYVALGCQ